MATRRTERLNSLLKEVISEVIHRDIHHVEGIDMFITITRVDITEDLMHAKVYISVIGKDKDKKRALMLLKEKAGRIARMASKKVVMRLFPVLEFLFDEGLEKQLKMEDLFQKISKEREGRTSQDNA
jgi:ribosome-binding factor A